MSDLLTGLGLVAVIEGLVLALAPLRFEEVLEVLRAMDPGTRRFLGLGLFAAGVFIVWIGRSVIA